MTQTMLTFQKDNTQTSFHHVFLSLPVWEETRRLIAWVYLHDLLMFVKHEKIASKWKWMQNNGQKK